MNTSEAIWTKWLYDKEFEKVFKNIGKDLWEDLRQEVSIICFEYDKEKLSDIVSKGKNVFKFWVVRIFFYQVSSMGKIKKTYNVLNSPGLKKGTIIPIEDLIRYLQNNMEVVYGVDPDLIKQIRDKIETLYWYDKEILKLYIELGSCRKVAKQVGIPHTSIFITVKEAQRCIKQSLEF